MTGEHEGVYREVTGLNRVLPGGLCPVNEEKCT